MTSQWRVGVRDARILPGKQGHGYHSTHGRTLCRYTRLKFEKKVQLLDAPQKGVPSLRLVAFATPASDTERENMLQKGVSIVKNVLVADPRIGLVTRPFMRDSKKPTDATLLVTVSLVSDNRITTRKTTAYTLPGSEPLAQMGLASF